MRNVSLQRAARRRAHRPDVHRARRPFPDGEFDLAYVRSMPGDGPPVFVLPGGPGLASVLPYEGFRRLAAARGLDVLMMEHRGIGLSRQDPSGVDLPQSAMTIGAVLDDMAAVLDDCGAGRAVVYGSSYGSYLAAAFGARHPDRVAGMLLDSPMLSARHDRLARDNLRRLFWDGCPSGLPGPTGRLRALVRDGVVAAVETGPVVQIAYEFGGLRVLERLLDAVAAGRGSRTWRWLAGLGDAELNHTVRYLAEFDIAGAIAFRELGYGAEPDWLPLDPQASFAPLADRFPRFGGGSFDLPAELDGFDWPTVALSGERDLRTPRVVAESIVDRVPGSVLLPVTDLGHSVLDTHPLAALHAAHAVVCGTHRYLPALAPRISALPRRGRQRALGPLISARLAGERFLPRPVR